MKIRGARKRMSAYYIKEALKTKNNLEHIDQGYLDEALLNAKLGRVGPWLRFLGWIVRIQKKDKI